MKKSRLLGAVSAMVFSCITLSSQAALVGVLPATPGGTDYQAYWDEVDDLTWLANANAGAGSAFDDGSSTTDGRMTWQSANDWAASLDIDGIAGPDGWRLPDTLQPDSSCLVQSGSISYGHNCTGSEMGNLFYNVLGGVADSSIATTHNSNYDLFSNVQPSVYWSSTEYAPNPSNAWLFNFGNGNQDLNGKIYSYWAWAVQSGNAGAVPVPAAIWLFGSGLLGLIGIARRRKHQ